MVKSKARLGKGLSALIPAHDHSKPEINSRLIEVDPRLIKTNPYQPRLDFDAEALEELKQSIKENGLIQPLAIREVDGFYELIAGERRLRSVIELGYSKVPVYLLQVSSKEEMLEIALIENVQREKLNVVELAVSYRRLIDECDLTIEMVGKKIGKQRSTINNIIRLLKLPDEILDALKRNDISMGHARALLGLTEMEQQLDLLDRIKKQDLSVRAVERLVKQWSSDEGPKTRVPITKKPYHNRVENLLRQNLGTQVRLNPKKKGGSIEIEYYTDEDLERLYELFGQLGD